MLRYSWKSITRNPIQSFWFTLAFLTIFMALPLSLSMLNQSRAIIDTNIQEYARGSYDLLIRPSGSQSKVEQEIGAVEENYLAVGSGGITLEEWQAMKELDHIDIAAPIASLGYFAGEQNTMELANPETSSFIELEYQTSDGVNHYSLGSGGSYYFLEENDFFEGFDYVEQNTNLDYLNLGARPVFKMPTTYHLMVGIDQEEEEKLTGIDLSAFHEPISPNLIAGYQSLNVGKHIPVIYLEDTHVSLDAIVDVTSLDWSSAQTKHLKNELNVEPDLSFVFSENYYELFDQFKDIPKLNKETYWLQLTEQINPFQYTPFSITYDGQISTPMTFAFGVSESSRFYHTEKIDYEILDQNKLSVKQIQSESEVPVFREMKEQGGAAYELAEIPFLIYPVGSFTTEEYQSSLSSSPLGIYQQAPSTLKKDGTTLHETLTPGSFVSAPAQGLVSLESAVHIKGESPIDAIRVRVSDITAYDEKAINRISEAVTEISKIGDFQIDVVAGASPTDMEMIVEGIGEVTQPWTSLGAATHIHDGWNTANVMISSMLIIVSFGYLSNRFLFRRYTKQEEHQILFDLGWKMKHIQRNHLLEQLLLMFFAIVVALIIFTFIDSTIYHYLAATILLTLLVCIVLSYKKEKAKVTSPNVKIGQPIWLRNLVHYRKFLWLTFIQLLSVSILSIFVLATLEATIDLTNATYLGQFINNSLSLVLLFIMIASLFLAFLSIGESTTGFLLLRSEELMTLRDIGWKISDVRNLCLKESAFWLSIAIFSGTLISILLLSILFSLTWKLIFISIAMMLSLIFIAIFIAYLSIRSSVNKLVN
ncbi:hypothetical protein [Alkalihalobacillus sp. 1P02AB]|uniref:hypothetical protein n=1 Tax=Alkalihalobacillus sp. 1P02AB TaxID=3132260 RepID=UPI0039A607EF